MILASITRLSGKSLPLGKRSGLIVYSFSHFFHTSALERQQHWTVRDVYHGVTYHTLHVFDDGFMADLFDNGGSYWQTHHMYRSLYIVQSTFLGSGKLLLNSFSNGILIYQ